MLKQIHGIIPAMVTPLDDREEIDEETLRSLVNYLIKGGVHGLFPMGSQGEFYGFSDEEKRKVWKIVVEETAGRVPIYAGTSAITTKQVIELCKIAEDSGVDAVSILTPFFIRPSENELYDHYNAIADATSLPIILYNNPDRTGVNLSVKLIVRLSQDPRFVGLKDSSGNLTYTLDLINQVPDRFAVLMGRDSLILAALLHGCTGAIAATANIVPELAVEIYTAFLEGNMERSLKAQQKLLPLRLAFDLGTFPSVIKEAMSLIGLPVGPARKPVGPLSAEARGYLARAVEEIFPELTIFAG